ncbi:MAG TPA: hypothetical protein VJ521_07855 [Acidobacteriota bacterium]|nr:hypothetical protein [Acidobacteriota bacterium]
MSGLAGLILIVYGVFAAYLGVQEARHFHLLTPYAAYWTTAIGVILILVGLAYFRAPHKAFLLSIPALLYFHVQMYFNALFYFARPFWPEQLSLASISLLALLLGYRGYKQKSSL